VIAFNAMRPEGAGEIRRAPSGRMMTLECATQGVALGWYSAALSAPTSANLGAP